MSDVMEDAPTGPIPPAGHAARPMLPRFIRAFAVPIVLAWVVIVALLNTVVPQLEEVGKMRAVSMSPNDAPARPADDRSPWERRQNCLDLIGTRVGSLTAGQRGGFRWKS